MLYLPVPFHFYWCLVKKIQNGVIPQRRILLTDVEPIGSKSNTGSKHSVPLPMRITPFLTSPRASHPTGVREGRHAGTRIGLRLPPPLQESATAGTFPSISSSD
jgi:hypothetical protein